MKKVLKPFKFGTMKTAADFEKTMTEAGLPFPVDENVDVLAKPIQIGDKIVPNRLCIQPLEGFDGEPDGSPSDLIRRRYKRYAGHRNLRRRPLQSASDGYPSVHGSVDQGNGRGGQRRGH